MRTRTVAILAAVGTTAGLLAGCTAPRPVARGVTHRVAADHPSYSRTIRRAAPSPVPAVAAKIHRPNPCRRDDGGQLVRVSLRRQRMWLCAHHRVVRRSAVTSGMAGQYTETPRGHFTIQALERDQTLTLITGEQYQVKYWIPFEGPLFGFHDASWQTFPFGSPRYRTQGSHGCVHLPLRTIAFLYHWAHVGTRVVIR